MLGNFIKGKTLLKDGRENRDSKERVSGPLNHWRYGTTKALGMKTQNGGTLSKIGPSDVSKSIHLWLGDPQI